MPLGLTRPAGLRRPAGPGADRRATWLELFFDLAFAAAIADAGVALSGDYTMAGLARFGVLFFLIWWAWVGHTFFSTAFDNDDSLHRLLTLAQVFLVAVMSVNTRTDMASREAAGFAAAYAGIRLLLAVQFGRVLGEPQTRRFVRRQIAGIVLAAFVWLASALAGGGPRLGLIAIALVIELVTPLLARRAAGVIPADPAHLPERFGLFTLILLGESVVAITAGMRHQETWTAPAAGSAILGLLVAFALWWAYFDVLGAANPKPVRTAADHQRLQVWTTVHLPLTFGIAVAAVGIERVIQLDGLTPLGDASRLLAGGVGLTILALGVLAVGSPDRASPFVPTLARHLVLALLLIPAAAVGAVIAPVWLLLWFVVLLLGLIVAGHRDRGREAGDETVERVAAISLERSGP